jgi:hypothetical protein
MHRGHTIHDAMSAFIYVRRLSFKPGTSVTSPPTTLKSKSNFGSSTSAMVNAPKQGNTPIRGAKIKRNVNAHSNSVNETGTDNVSCAARTPNTTSGSPFQNTERSISTAPSFTVSKTFTPSIFAGTDPNENFSNRNAVRKLGRVARKIGSSAATITSLVATSRYGHAAAKTLFTQPPRLDVAEREPRGEFPDQILDLGLVQRRKVRQRRSRCRALSFSFLHAHAPREEETRSHGAEPNPRTAAPNSPSKGFMKFSAAAARSFCRDVSV